MSTYQPPGGQQPEGTPGYVPPQDPWAGGFEPGHASVPTDPIPQQYQQYQGYPQGDVWSQPTVAQGAGYAYPPRPRRTGLVVLIFLLVLVLGGAGGFAAWYVTTQRNAGGGPSTPPPSSSTAPSASATPAQAFDPHLVKDGDCLINKGTAKVPKMELTACNTPGSFKVIQIRTGVDIPENGEGKFDAPVTSVAMCEGTGYETWYGYKDAVDEAKDVFFCMTNN